MARDAASARPPTFSVGKIKLRMAALHVAQSHEPCPQPCAPDTPLSKNDMHITLCLAGHGTADTRSPTAIARGNKIVADLVDHAFARVADGAMLSPRTVLCAEIVKSYCAANAPLSVDKIAGSAAVTLAALPRDPNTQVAVDALNVIRLEAANERRVKKKPPIKLEHFWHASRVMSDDAHKLLDGDDCDFKLAGLLVRAVLTIDALPARVHTLAAVQWRSVNALDTETGWGAAVRRTTTRRAMTTSVRARCTRE